VSGIRSAVFLLCGADLHTGGLVGNYATSRRATFDSRDVCTGHQAVPVKHKEMYSEKAATAGGRLVAVLMPRAVLEIQPQLYFISAPLMRQLLSSLGAI
jgi:hypothetical protein